MTSYEGHFPPDVKWNATTVTVSTQKKKRSREHGRQVVSKRMWQRRKEEKQVGGREKVPCLPRPLDSKQVVAAIIRALSVITGFYIRQTLHEVDLSNAIKCGKVKKHSTVH